MSLLHRPVTINDGPALAELQQIIIPEKMIGPFCEYRNFSEAATQRSWSARAELLSDRRQYQAAHLLLSNDQPVGLVAWRPSLRSHQTEIVKLLVANTQPAATQRDRAAALIDIALAAINTEQIWVRLPQSSVQLTQALAAKGFDPVGSSATEVTMRRTTKPGVRL